MKALQNNGFTDKAEAKNEFVNGLKEGKWIEYTKDLAWVAVEDHSCYRLKIYRKGEPIGIVREFDERDRVISETPFIDGKVNGIKKEYDENGNLRTELPFIDGKLNGIAKQYFSSGKILSESRFKDGITEGGNTYHKNGQLHTSAIFTDGKWEVLRYDENGNPIKQ